MDVRAILSFGMFLACCMANGGNISTSIRRNLIDCLLDPKKYDSFSIPDLERDYPTDVTVQITFNNVHTVSETSMEYSVDMLLRQWWRDHRLNFSSCNTTIEKLEIDPKLIDAVWHPDTFFPNEKRASFHTVTTKNRLLHISPDGTVVSSVRLAVTLTCELDLSMYPFDGQRCPFKIQSFGYTERNIKLKWQEDAPFILNRSEIPQFQLSKEVVLRDCDAFFPTTGTYSLLKAEITLMRNAGFYFLQLFVPSVLLVVLSWVSFWVDPNAVPARVSLGVTCVLTMTTQRSGTLQTLPPVSYVKAIDVWMFVCLLFVFAALLQFAYVNVVLRRQPPSENAEEEINAEEGKETDKETKLDGLALAKRIDLISRLAFPGAFAVFLCIFAFVCAFAPQSYMNDLESEPAYKCVKIDF